MTFLELQNKIEQTRKARRGVNNRKDYFEDDPNEEFYSAVYRKALSIANQIVKHYEEVGAVDPKDKPKLTWK